MLRRLKRLAQNLALAAASGLVCLLALEFVVFRTILVPDDVLENITINHVVRYKPTNSSASRQTSPDAAASARF
ncbi:MAG: hypothetical protein AAFV26_01290 [Pseudomonadota bacterium]